MSEQICWAVFLGCKAFTAIVLILINFNNMNNANSELHGRYTCRFVWRSVETCFFPRDVTRAILDKRRATRRGEDFLVSWSRSTSTSSIFRGVYTHTHTHTHTGFIGALPIANSFPSINWKRYQFEWTVFLSGCWLVFLCWWNCCIYPSVGCLAFLLLPSW